jgi:quinolinate synthase
VENSDMALIQKIENLKKRRNAVILAHNFQPGEVQDIADFVGDSLEIACKVSQTKADIVVVCGVRFVAEIAAIFRPDKAILLPDSNAICPMAGMITADRLREEKKKYPGAVVVCHLKSSAEVKAESDVCCTSSNAVSIIRKLASGAPVIFAPDQYLGDYVCLQTGREMILWPGYCPSHYKIDPEDVVQQKTRYSQAKLIVHQECTPQVRALADAVLSGREMVNFARETGARQIIVGTETGILHRLRKENPDKQFIPASDRAVCGKMKLITMETILWSLENTTYPVSVPDDIRLKAKKAIDKMLKMQGPSMHGGE